MTAMQGYVPPSRRPGELGVHSLDHFALTVPDLELARRFYNAFGLHMPEEGGKLGIYVPGQPHRWGILSEGPRKQHGFISFGVFEDDFAGFRKRLQDLGVKQLDPPAGHETNGLWFRDPDGNLIELAVARKSSPDAKSQVSISSVPGGVRGAPGRSAAPNVSPRRFAHMLLFTTDVPRSIEFYGQVLGMRLSDRSADIIAFMHGIHGSDHHMPAFAKSSAPGHHHTSWDVGTVNDIGLGALQMLNAGHEKGWGLGRHVLGSNYFHYVRDPWGSYCEYSCDIDYVPHDCDWEGGDHSGPDSFYIWGPNVPADFVHNYEGDR